MISETWPGSAVYSAYETLTNPYDCSEPGARRMQDGCEPPAAVATGVATTATTPTTTATATAAASSSVRDV